MFAKKDVCNAKINNIEDKILDIANLATKTTKMNEVKGEIPGITNLSTTAVLIAVETKKPSISKLVKKKTDAKINEIEKKITGHDHNKYRVGQKNTPKFQIFIFHEA